MVVRHVAIRVVTSLVDVIESNKRQPIRPNSGNFDGHYLTKVETREASSYWGPLTSRCVIP